ncbi:MAG: lysophospholipase [Acidimicrobiales bacterium]|jgi:acylglycerol lipase|nr:lysophospholipase [Acidimicrobiales bacterium]HLV90575.1 lysophospholipase [Acidimicrobiia bacterium]
MALSIAVPRPHPRYGTELVRDWAAEGEPIADVVLIHGIAEHSGRYEAVGDQLSGAGFQVRGFDLVGHGVTGGRRGHIDDWSEYHDQVQSHVEEMRASGRPLVLLGHSMGGNIALGYAASDRPSPDLVVVSAPALAGGAGWQRKLAPIAARIAPTLPVPQQIRGDQLSRDPMVGERYFADPLVVTKATTGLGAALFAAMDRVAADAEKIEVPVLVLHGEADTIVRCSSTEILGSLDGFERRTYPDLRHELFNEPEGPQIIDEVIVWVKERL